MEARLSPRGLLSIAAIAATVALTSACGGGGDASAAKDPQLVKYANSFLSFSHPSTWTASPFRTSATVLHFNPLVYLSTQPLEDPCTKHGNETTCGFPVKHLQPGSVLAVWQTNELPITSPVKLTGGTSLQVDGHPAVQKETADGECRSIGADRTVEVDIKLSDSRVIYLTACLRAPGLAQDERDIDALLASTKFLSQ